MMGPYLLSLTSYCAGIHNCSYGCLLGTARVCTNTVRHHIVLVSIVHMAVCWGHSYDIYLLSLTSYCPGIHCSHGCVLGSQL